MKPVITRHDIVFAIIATIALAIGYLASDICLPALPLLVQHFQISNAQAQHILSIYLLGLGVALFISGPITDHIGCRKTALLACFGLLLASCWCAMSSTQPMLLTARFFQAFCAGFLATSSRASIVQFYKPEVAAIMFIRATPATSISPAIAPFIGGYLTYHFSWHATFWALAVICILLFIALFQKFHIPNAITAKKLPTLRNLLHIYKTMLSNPIFVGYLILVTSVFSVYLVYITDAPFILHQHQWSTIAIGYSFTPIALTFFISSQITRPLLKYISSYRVMSIGVLLAFTSFFCYAMIGVYHWPITSVVFSACLMAFANGFISPLCFREALPIYKNNAGIATSLFTAAPFLGSTVASYFVHDICGTNLLYLGLFCAAIMAVGSIGLMMVRLYSNP